MNTENPKFQSLGHARAVRDARIAHIGAYGEWAAEKLEYISQAHCGWRSELTHLHRRIEELDRPWIVDPVPYSDLKEALEFIAMTEAKLCQK